MCNICFFLRVRSPWSNHCSLYIGPGTVVVVGRSHKIGLVIGGNTVPARKFSNKFSQNLLQEFLSFFAWRYQDDISKKRTWPFFWKKSELNKIVKNVPKMMDFGVSFKLAPAIFMIFSVNAGLIIIFQPPENRLSKFFLLASKSLCMSVCVALCPKKLWRLSETEVSDFSGHSFWLRYFYISRGCWTRFLSLTFGL